MTLIEMHFMSKKLEQGEHCSKHHPLEIHFQNNNFSLAYHNIIFRQIYISLWRLMAFNLTVSLMRALTNGKELSCSLSKVIEKCNYVKSFTLAVLSAIKCIKLINKVIHQLC